MSLPEGLGLWTAGTITAGERDARSGLSNGFDFRRDGITVGADWRIDDRFLFGVAVGFGWSNTEFDAPRSTANSVRFRSTTCAAQAAQAGWESQTGGHRSPVCVGGTVLRAVSLPATGAAYTLSRAPE